VYGVALDQGCLGGRVHPLAQPRGRVAHRASCVILCLSESFTLPLTVIIPRKWTTTASVGADGSSVGAHVADVDLAGGRQGV
jgi:hypothetical protein